MMIPVHQVYEANPNGDRRIRDPHLVVRVYEAFGAELKRRAVNRARFG